MTLCLQLPSIHHNEAVLLDSLPDCTRQNLRELDQELAAEQDLWERLLLRADTLTEARQIEAALLSSARVRAAIHQEQARRSIGSRLGRWRESVLQAQAAWLERHERLAAVGIGLAIWLLLLVL